jgi:drug/metabolite transporter (DMT)-like permease
MMFAWIIFTVLAAFMQAWRNAFQKQLSSSVDVYGVTLARFIFAWPLAMLYLVVINQLQPSSAVLHFNLRYWGYVLIAALAQIVATILMVQLFKQKNYAIGVGLAKSEAILAALIGVLCLNEWLSVWGWCGVLLGAIAVFLLSLNQQLADFKCSTLGIGLGSGLAFAITSLLVRQASLQLPELPVLHRAAWVLCSVIGLQCLMLLLFLGLFRRQTLYTLTQRWQLVLQVSLCSFLASLGWFSAMSMQSVAIVKTLGQIEVLFSVLISVFYFKERLRQSDYGGLVLIVIAAVMVIWV